MSGNVALIVLSWLWLEVPGTGERGWRKIILLQMVKGRIIVSCDLLVTNIVMKNIWLYEIIYSGAG